MGSLFLELHRYEEAEKHLRNALQIDQSLENQVGIATDNQSLGILFFRTGQQDSALEYLAKSLKIYKELDLKIEQANIHIDIARCYRAKGEKHLMLEHYSYAQDILSTINTENQFSEYLEQIEQEKNNSTI